MKLATVSIEGRTAWGEITDEGFHDHSALHPQWPTLRDVIEAGALEKPVIVTDLGAVQETVVAGDNKTRTGWKIPPNDPAAMADALKQALDMNPQQRDRIGQRARQHVTARFSLQQMCRRTLQVYEDLMPS